MCFQFQSALLDLIQLHTPVGKVARWSSMQGHMLQSSGLEGGVRCGSLGGGGKAPSPGSLLPGSGSLPVQIELTDQGSGLIYDVAAVQIF